MQEAFQACLDRVCAFIGWPVGHVCVVNGDQLKWAGGTTTSLLASQASVGTLPSLYSTVTPA